MPFDPGLEPGDELDNKALTSIFKCAPQGGMRKSNTTGTLVLVSSPSAVYADRWINGELHYTGMGLNGNQKMDRQNRTLRDLPSNDVDAFLFEVMQDGVYTYLGQVDLAGDPYQQEQEDRSGTLRRVWMFPLRVRGPVPLANGTELHAAMETREAAASRLAPEELLRRAQNAPARPSSRNSQTTTMVRDPHVAAYALMRAAGRCQLCEGPAPFVKRNGAPYLEVHHIEWLAKGGSDTVDNTVALCANCHRKMHSLDRSADRSKLQTAASHLRTPDRS